MMHWPTVTTGTLILALAALAPAAARKTCLVHPGGTNTTDDAPAILDAFRSCGRHGRVVFANATYHVNSVLDIAWLDDVEIDLWGTLEVCPCTCTHAYCILVVWG